MTKDSSKGCKPTPYDIFSSNAPAMPKPGKGTKVIDLLISQVSKDMREPIVPMIFPALGAFAFDVKFSYSDNVQHELCGMMGHLVGPSGIGKGQLTRLVEAIMHSFREHDKGEYQKLFDWQKEVKTKGSNSKKPERPDVCFWFPPANMTNPAFIQNAMACENDGNRTQYLDLPEIEMANSICGGHKNVSKTLRVIYDVKNAGALRSTVDGVTGDPVLRANLTFSSTPDEARLFYKRDLVNGFFGRVPFAYKGRGERLGRIPRQGNYDESFFEKINVYLERLKNSHGNFIVKPLNKIANELAMEMVDIADLSDNDTLFEYSHRCVLSAWKKGAVLWLLNEQTWSKSIGEFVRWFCYYDLWSKIKVFGDMFKDGDIHIDETKKNGPTNMLDKLEDSFSEQQLEDLRASLGNNKSGTKHQLNVWKNRGHITYSEETQLYTKTEAYKSRVKK